MRTYQYRFPANGHLDKNQIEPFTASLFHHLTDGASGHVSWPIFPMKDGEALNRIELDADENGNINGISIFSKTWMLDWDDTDLNFQECMTENLQCAAEDCGFKESPIMVTDVPEFLGREDQSTILYHITEKKNLDTILKDGLTPGIGDNASRAWDDFVFLTEKEDIPRWISILYQVNDPVILEINVKDLSGICQGRWYVDRKYAMPTGYGEYFTRETIPASHIKKAEFTEDDRKELCDAMNEQLTLASSDTQYKAMRFMAERSSDDDRNEVLQGIERFKKLGVMNYSAEDEVDFSKAVDSISNDRIEKAVKDVLLK